MKPSTVIKGNFSISWDIQASFWMFKQSEHENWEMKSMAEKIKLESWNAKPSVAIKMKCYFCSIKPMRKRLKGDVQIWRWTVNAMYAATFHRRGPCLLCQQTVLLINAYWKIDNSQQNGNNRNRINETLTILLKIRTIQCLEIPILLSNLCSVYLPFSRA
jgi:hypothetical protein